MLLLFNLNDHARSHAIAPFISRLIRDGYRISVVTECYHVAEYFTGKINEDVIYIGKSNISADNGRYWGKSRAQTIARGLMVYLKPSRALLHYVMLLPCFFGVNILKRQVAGKFYRTYNFVSHAIELKQVDVFLSLSDRNLWLDLVISKICEDYGKPLVIPYLSHLAGPERLYKQSRYGSFRGRTFFPCYMEEVFRGIFSGPRSFFQIGEGVGSILCGNLEMMFARKGFAQLPRDKRFVCGDLNFLRFGGEDETQDFDKGSIDIVFSVPQFFEHGLMGRDVAFAELNKLLDWLECLDRKVTAVLHPRSNLEDYEELFESRGIEVYEGNLVGHLLAQSSLFVCTYSTTHEWAYQLGKPCIMLDQFFGFSYNEGFCENESLIVVLPGQSPPTKRDVEALICSADKSDRKPGLRILGEQAYNNHLNVINRIGNGA